MGHSDWRAGHMGHAAETIKRLAPYLTALIEVVDARAPQLTRFGGWQRWAPDCPVLLVLNKEDLADPAVTASWIRYFQARGTAAVALQANRPGGERQVLAALRTLPVAGGQRRAAVVGLPNLGKSTLLNRLIGRHRLRTGDRPGVTRGPQWIRRHDWDWLDLPGVLTRAQGRDWRLKVLGVVGYPAAEAEALAEEILRRTAWGQASDPVDAFGQARGFLQRGGVVDRQRAAEAALAAFRDGSLGRWSLEVPTDAT
jgi:ribosome biogenesis GTPase A